MYKMTNQDPVTGIKIFYRNSEKKFELFIDNERITEARLLENEESLVMLQETRKKLKKRFSEFLGGSRWSFGSVSAI